MTRVGLKRTRPLTAYQTRSPHVLYFAAGYRVSVTYTRANDIIVDNLQDHRVSKVPALQYFLYGARTLLKLALFGVTPNVSDWGFWEY